MSRGSYLSCKPLPLVPTTVHVDSLDDEYEEKRTTTKPWRPVTLKPVYLIALILATAGLIIVLQLLLSISHRENGLLFAKDINDLPLSRSFSYLYLPTLISVIYSFLWTWIDIDIKRLEPYFQLSRAGGSTSSNSLLLSYPLEFLATIPFTAFKRKHWSILTASMAMILVLWGLTPTQAGIFAVRTIHIRENVPGTYSKAYTPISQQGDLTAIYAQSVYQQAQLCVESSRRSLGLRPQCILVQSGNQRLSLNSNVGAPLFVNKQAITPFPERPRSFRSHVQILLL
jgi:hypothetical protein